jgi:oligosaccharyltransferase complex subunit epsilon
MAPKKISTNPSPSAIPPSSTKATTVVPSAAGAPTYTANKPASNASTNTASKSSTGSKSGSVRNATDLQQIGAGVWNKYVDETPQRVKLLDAFLVFLIAVGVLQFVYCVIAGNFVSPTYHGVL